MNFKLQEMTEILRGNSMEDNEVLQRIAARLVQHQRGTESTPQAIVISLPEEGEVSTFSRSVQVTENAPLELNLTFASNLDIPMGRRLFTYFILFFGAVTFVGALAWKDKNRAA